MTLPELAHKLKTTTYTLPKVNYDFLRKVVIVIGNSDVAITPTMSYDQYKLAKKLLQKYKD